MHPDAAGTQRRQPERKAFTDALPIGLRTASAPEQTQQDQGQAEVEQQRIEGAIHGRGA